MCFDPKLQVLKVGGERGEDFFAIYMVCWSLLLNLKFVDVKSYVLLIFIVLVHNVPACDRCLAPPYTQTDSGHDNWKNGIESTMLSPGS